MPKKLKVLVVDDTELNLLLISKLITAEGHLAVAARNGQEAVDMFLRESPDLILMDVMMPVMDGYEATTRIRKLAGEKWIPVIFLSAKAQDQDQVQGLEAGGDDYLTKPVNLTLLKAKIKAMQRIAEMQRVITENAEQLTRYREENEREEQLAKHLLERIIYNEEINNPLIRHYLKPTSNFSGDIIAAAATPGGILHIVLADGTGHGLSAALNAMPVIEVFYGMTEKGFSISSIAQELNRKIKLLLPTERFVAAVLVSIDLSKRAIRIWNGGAPTAYFVSENGEILNRWESNHPPLGILDYDSFDGKTEIYYWHDDGQLILTSDGVVEAENADGERFGYQRVRDALASEGNDERFDYLKRSLENFLGDRPGQDDISMVGVRCPLEYSGETIAPEHVEKEFNYHISPGQWRLNIELSAAELKSLDVLPLLMNWLGQIRLNQKQCRELFLIITELYNNALDHGILGLDSSLKCLEDGFDRFLSLREERLAALQEASVIVELQRMHQGEQDFLVLRVHDSGPGFDFSKLVNCDLGANMGFAGRGIALVKSLCAKLEYLNEGNEVVAIYTLT
ncbi:MAG: SpoIIE family protein phosphatase [Sulfuricella sp.]|nr:SpoIIE family protein phosphatase [Sulfuricella sp.]